MVIFCLVAAAAAMAFVGCGSSSHTPDAPPSPHSINGSLGSAGAGAILTYPGGNTIANGLGDYAFKVPNDWSGTVTPGLTGCTFAPASRSYSNVRVDQNAQNYQATAITLSISGTLGAMGAGAVVSYADLQLNEKTTTADGAGNYRFTVSRSWCGNVTPRLAGYVFSPSVRGYSGVVTDQAAQDYTTTIATFMISGWFTPSGAGTKLSYNDGSAKSVTADSSGSYTFTVPYNWSGTVTPSLTGSTFNPASRSYSNVRVDQNSQNYQATANPPRISGTLGALGAGAVISYVDLQLNEKTTTADGAGNYSFTVPFGWCGNVTPRLTGYVFSPSVRGYSNVSTDQLAQDSTTTLATFTISGWLTPFGAGTKLSYNDGSAKSVTADSSGSYTFTVPYNWSGTVTPSLTGSTFNPASRSYSNVRLDQNSQNYQATANPPTISGTLGVLGAGAVISYADCQLNAKTTTADGAGNYSFTVSRGWCGNVTPRLAGYVFNPSVRGYSNVQTDQVAQDSTTTLATFTISGWLTPSGAGAKLSYNDGSAKSVTADSNGSYTFTVPYNWSGTVTPNLPGDTFSPASRSYSSVQADQTSQHYEPAPIVHSISGSLGALGANAYLQYVDGRTKWVSADASGNYTLSVSYNWSGTVTPSLSGYTFSPASRSYSSVQADQTSQHYEPAPNFHSISGSLGALGANASLQYFDGRAKWASADASGNYTLSVSYTWSGTVTPSKAGTTFSPENHTYSNVLADIPGQDFTPTYTMHTISGTVRTFTAGVITLSYFDGVAKTVMTDDSGHYSFTVPSYWSGTVTPSQAGVSFSPTSRTYDNVQNDMYDNYGYVFYAISGSLGPTGALAKVTFADSDGRTSFFVWADASGNYSNTVVRDWSGTVTPSLSHTAFEPSNRTYAHVTADQSAQDYLSSRVYFIDGGLGADGIGATLAYVDGSSKTVTADAHGNYRITVSENWSGTVVPSLAATKFSPDSRTYSHVTSDLMSEHYSSTHYYSLSGSLGPAGVGATLSYYDGSWGSVTADSAGNYQFWVPAHVGFKVTPILPGYTFLPANRPYAPLQADQSGQDFTVVCLVSGYLGTAGAGASMTYDGGVITADGLGHYSIPVSPGWSGTVTPSLGGQTFTPVSRIYGPVAANQLDQNYVTTANGDAKAITTFAFSSASNPSLTQDAVATVNGHSIVASLPAGTDVTALTPTFTTTGQSVSVGAVVQISGGTANDFTSPMTYTVEAADASTATYIVNVVQGSLALNGSYQDASGQGQAYCWKDGQYYALPLPPSTTLVNVTPLSRSGGAIYIAGTYLTGGTYQACYWTLDASSQVTRTELISEVLYKNLTPNTVSAILVDSGNIFIEGRKFWGSNSFYPWQDEQVAGLLGDLLQTRTRAPEAFANSMTVYKGRHWSAGYGDPSSANSAFAQSSPEAGLVAYPAQPTYWSAGQRTPTHPALPSFAQPNGAAINALFGDVNHLYAAGWWVTASNLPEPFYYQDWAAVDLAGTLPVAQPYGNILGASGDGTNTYLAGWYGADAAAKVPCYWKLDASTPQPSPVTLGVPSGGFGQAWSVSATTGSPCFAGYYQLSGKTYCCYWTANGLCVDLTVGLPSGFQASEAVGISLQ
jgi:hypothetical protein